MSVIIVIVLISSGKHKLKPWRYSYTPSRMAKIKKTKDWQYQVLSIGKIVIELELSFHPKHLSKRNESIYPYKDL